MKSVLFLFALSILFPFHSFSQCPESFHDFTALDIHGDTVHMSSFAGKKLLVVNTASFCGYTPQYAQLQSLYTNYGGDNFEIIGFPANNFAGQEPYDEDSIIQVCNSYNVTFTMMSKISVKGSSMHPIYHWLTKESQNCEQNAPVNWNFQKFMVNADGSWHGVAFSSVPPASSSIVNWINISTTLIDNASESNENCLVYQSGNNINIKLETEAKVTVRMFSTSGQLVTTLAEGQMTKETAIPFSENIKNGLYIIEIAGEGILFRKKLLLNK